jgi:putative ABC transport system permease protein
MFFVAGLSITASATLVVVFNASWFLAIIGLLGKVLGGTMPAVRTAIAYPLAARFRTGMTLSMFGLVVFSLVVMASLNYNFTQLFLGESATAGFDVVVKTNENNRVDDLRETLSTADPAALRNIEGVGTLVATRADAVETGVAGADFQRAIVRGVDNEFLRIAPLTMLTRAHGYADDRAVLEALRADPSTAIIGASFLRPASVAPFRGAPARFQLSMTERDLRNSDWEPIGVTVRDRETGATRELRVIGVLDPKQSRVLSDLSALLTSDSNIASTFAGGKERSFLLTTRNRDKTAVGVAHAVESTLLEQGVQANSIHQEIQDAAQQSTGFQLLFEGFMGLGLVVGIAALGVIAFRTVVERRQQIGMLRAIGYTRRLVALSFFLESSFIALTGIAMGVTLGVALSYNLLANPDFTAGTQIEFHVPWLRLGIIGAIAYGFSALMTLLPARAASRVPVAEALRYE